MITVPLLRFSTFTYLALPIYLFYLGWLNLFVGLLGCLLITGILYQVLNEKAAEAPPSPLSRRALWLTGGLAFILTLFSGTGQFSYQTYDYWIHNAKIADLTAHTWPLFYQQTGQAVCYYFGYFLPIAFIAKWVGFANIISLIWTTAGLWLVLLWVYCLSGRSLVTTLLVTLFSTPLNTLCILSSYTSQGPNLTNIDAINIPYSSLFPYMSFVKQLNWIPNQMLPAGLGVGVLLSDGFYWRKQLGIWLLLALLLYWSPFVSIGLGVLAAVIWLGRPSFWQWLRRPAGWVNALLIVAAFMPILAYFKCSNGLQRRDFLWQIDEHWLRSYGIFVLGDVLIIAALLWVSRLKTPYQQVLKVALLYMALVPLIRIGQWNDFYLRSTLPGLLVLGMAMAQAVWQAWQVRQKKVGQLLLMIVFGLSLLSPIGYLGRAVSHNRLTGQPPLFDPGKADIYQAMLSAFGPVDVQQYSCKDGCFYRTYLEKK